MSMPILIDNPLLSGQLRLVIRDDRFKPKFLLARQDQGDLLPQQFVPPVGVAIVEEELNRGGPGGFPDRLDAIEVPPFVQLDVRILPTMVDKDRKIL